MRPLLALLVAGAALAAPAAPASACAATVCGDVNAVCRAVLKIDCVA